MLKTMNKTNKIKKPLKWTFSGFSILFIVMLLSIVIHDIMTGESSNTEEYCIKYSFFASPGCW